MSRRRLDSFALVSGSSSRSAAAAGGQVSGLACSFVEFQLSFSTAKTDIVKLSKINLE